MASSRDLVFKSLLAFAGLWFSLFPPLVFSQVPFYQDKTITIIQGREPGGFGRQSGASPCPVPKEVHPGKPYHRE